MNDLAPPAKRTAKDFATDQEVRWCPGCGDYAILRAVQKTLADIDADPANTVFVSGIGCAARFPYYVETYGFHTIHVSYGTHKSQHNTGTGQHSRYLTQKQCSLDQRQYPPKSSGRRARLHNHRNPGTSVLPGRSQSL